MRKDSHAEFNIGDIVALDKGTGGFGIVELIRDGNLAVRLFDSEGGWSLYTQLPGESVLVMSASDVAGIAGKPDSIYHAPRNPVESVVFMLQLMSRIAERCDVLRGEVNDPCAIPDLERDDVLMDRLYEKVNALREVLTETLHSVIGNQTVSRCSGQEETCPTSC